VRVVGQGPLQNLTDLTLLGGIDMTILQVDVLDYARRQNFFPSCYLFPAGLRLRAT
jgi:hypothetical protein